MVKSETALTGMKEICFYVGKSKRIVLRLIKKEGLPAIKIGKIWESSTIQIDKWKESKIKTKG